MPKHHAIVALLLASSIGAQVAVAQAKPGQPGPNRASFGIVGGLNFATFTGTDIADAKTRTGFHAGAAVILPLGTSLFFQPQALYSMKGATASNGAITMEFKFNYLEVPLFLGLRVPLQGSEIRPYVMAGPYLGFKMGCKVKASWGGASAEVSCDESSVILDMGSSDLGLAFGAGVEVPMGRGMLSLGARYSKGLAQMMNSVISLGAGYFFGR